MPSKSLGLFPASLSTDPLFCLEFVEITNKIETAGDLKARERKGVAVGKDKYIVGFHMTSLKIQSKKTIDPTEILLSRYIKAAEN